MTAFNIDGNLPWHFVDKAGIDIYHIFDYFENTENFKGT